MSNYVWAAQQIWFKILRVILLESPFRGQFIYIYSSKWQFQMTQLCCAKILVHNAWDDGMTITTRHDIKPRAAKNARKASKYGQPNWSNCFGDKTLYVSIVILVKTPGHYLISSSRKSKMSCSYVHECCCSHLSVAHGASPKCYSPLVRQCTAELLVNPLL